MSVPINKPVFAIIRAGGFATETAGRAIGFCDTGSFKPVFTGLPTETGCRFAVDEILILAVVRFAAGGAARTGLTAAKGAFLPGGTAKRASAVHADDKHPNKAGVRIHFIRNIGYFYKGKSKYILNICKFKICFLTKIGYFFSKRFHFKLLSNNIFIFAF
jgi:hypothetical protein